MSENKISFKNAVALGINIMVGAGILGSPAVISAAGGLNAYFVWFFTALILSPIVYTCSRLPEVLGQGGFVGYCNKGLGKFWGFVGGWIYLLSYVFAVTGILSAFHLDFTTKFASLTFLSPLGVFLAIALVILLLVNLLPEVLLARLQGGLTVIKLIPVLCAIAFAPFFIQSLPLFAIGDLSNIFSAIPLSVFAFVGFEYLCNFSDKIEGGQAAAKKAIMMAFILVTIVYAMFHFSVQSIMGLENLIIFKASGYAPFVAQKFATIGNFLCLLLPVTTVVTFLNGSNGIITLIGNMFYSIARSNTILFGNVLSSVNSFGRPVVSIILTCLSVFVIALAIGDTSKVMIACGFIQMIILTIVIGVLIKSECGKTNYLDKALSWIALFGSMFLIWLSWVKIADSNYERLVALFPFVIGMIIGLLLYARPSCNSSDKINECGRKIR